MDPDTTVGSRPYWRRRPWAGAALVVVVAAVALLIRFSSSTAQAEQADLSGQGGEGLWSVNGVELRRTSDGLDVTLEIPRPMPGEYVYPPARTPSGGFHPPVAQGENEVFTLWMFVFNHPEHCLDPYVCRLVDIGGGEATTEPAAGGAIYQLDAIIASSDIIEMHGIVDVGASPVRGAALTNPVCSHVHIGMAPHGKALDGDDLEAQLTTGIGGPEWFWAAEFEFLDSDRGC